MLATSAPTYTHTTEAGSATRTRLLLFAISLAVIILDRVTKLLVSAHLAMGEAYVVIPRVFRITHVLNTGAAFSVFAESASPETVRLALIAFSVAAVAIVGTMLWRSGHRVTLSGIALALILGGALGNLYDRIRLHHVIDFLEFHIFTYHYPDFNVADSAIVIGACLLILEIFRPQPPASTASSPRQAE